MPLYQQILQREFSRRSKANPRYSLRAFALTIGADVGDLSKIMRNKKSPSLSSAQKIAERLQLSPRDKVVFFASLAETKVKVSTSTIESATEVPDATALDADVFQVIGDLYHYAILEMTFLKPMYERDARRVARYLGITVVEAQSALDRLLRLGLLKREADGQLIKVNRSLTTKDKSITTPAHRKHQHQVLRGALRSLELDSIDRRSITSMTMAVDPKKIPTAKIMIQEFMETLCAYLEDGERTELYQLGASLFPMQGSFKI